MARLGVARFLCLGAAISIVSYSLFLHWKTQEFNWWLVPTGECFNFFLGMTAGRYLSRSTGRRRMEAALRSPLFVSAAFVALLAGNICNQYRVTYPISSLAFTAPLAFCGAAMALWISKYRASSFLRRIDFYHLYLIHQPLAFPLLVLMIPIFHGAAIFFGIVPYFAIALILSSVFSRVVVRAEVMSRGAVKSNSQLSSSRFPESHLGDEESLHNSR